MLLESCFIEQPHTNDLTSIQQLRFEIRRFPASAVIAGLRLANRIILLQGLEIGIVGCFQGGIFFSFFQGLRILVRRKRFRDGDIVFAIPLTGRGFGNIIFSVTGLDDYGDALSGADFVRVQRGPEEIPLCLLPIFSAAKIGPGAVRLL